MTAFRQLVLSTHRWTGLFSSLILIIAGGTGAVLVWQGDHLLRKVAGRIHENLALGRPGAYVVLAVTAAAILLELGGLYLWWQRKSLSLNTRSGWRRTLFDLHHTAGALGFIVMIVIAATAALAPAIAPSPTRRMLMELHTSFAYPLPIRAVYCAASFGFVVQGTTGVVMWLRRRGSI